MHKILHLIAKIDKEDSKAPLWMLLFKAGLGKLSDGVEFLIDKQAFDLITAFVEVRGNEIHFDYEHASLQKEAAPASGWIKELTWEDGVGIKARVEWTEKATQFIANKEYRYFSPVFYIRKADKRVCGLDSVALTNRPRTTNLTPILARIEADAGLIAPPKGDRENIMDREKLIAKLGLNAGATDEQIWEALGTIGVKAKQEVKTEVETKTETVEVLPKEVIAALGIEENSDKSVVVASIHALKQHEDHSVSREEFTALQDQLKERDATEVVSAAIASGKVAPAQEEWATKYAKDDLEGFKIFVSKAPVVVPVDNLPGKQQQDSDSGSNGKLTDEDLQIAAMMGNDEEDLKKYGLEVKNG